VYETSPRGVAAFDFDGTLCAHHSIVRFLARTFGWPAVAVRLCHAALTAGGEASLRDRTKLAAIGRLCAGMTRTRFEECGQAYVEVLAGRLRPPMLERLRWHQDQGNATVIVSAALGAYLRPLAVRLGIDAVLAYELDCDDAGLLTGRVVGGLNTQGPHKAVRLRAWIDQRWPGEPVTVWAYGDSAGDRELLALADYPTWVGRGLRPSQR
jgi:phosphatidylglycerophosphatase C